MTISELHGDEDLRRREFPIVERQIYLAHAGVSPFPRRVADALTEYVSGSVLQDQERAWPTGLLTKLRRRAAAFIGARSEEIALIGPTSQALSVIADGVDLEAGDRVLVYQDDFPSNVYPWMALRGRGVEVDFLEVEKLGEITLECVESQLRDRTRLVALASCHYVSGYRIDHDAIGKMLRERGVLFALDAIQTVGAFPTNVANVDFMAADSHKWMLGPSAAGILYVADSAQSRLKTRAFGWHNVRCTNFVTAEELELVNGARRLEAGTHNLLGLLGLDAALQLFDEIGQEEIATELIAKRQWLVNEITDRGYQALSARIPSLNTGGMLSFGHADRDMAEVFRRLLENDIYGSLRQTRDGQSYLRLSPHFYNTRAELQKVVDLL